MKLNSSTLTCFALLFAIRPACGDEKANDVTDYQKAMRGLASKNIRANLPSEKMLDLCIPTSQRVLGRFTEYDFELLPGYHGLSILALDGRLKRATEWSCTYMGTRFDELKADDKKRYNKLFKENVHVPPERFIGRCGWERPPMRQWIRDERKTGDAP